MTLGDPSNPSVPGATPIAASDRAERELNLRLISFLLELGRGVEEFRRSYGVSSEERAWPTAEELTRRLVGKDASEARRELEALLSDLMVHQIALLEGYTEATHSGSLRLLDSLDPEKVRDQFDHGVVRVGPFRLSARSRPVLIQAIWEEILRRCRQYRALDAAQFERFFRDGFQRGYRRFWESRRGGGAAS